MSSSKTYLLLTAADRIEYLETTLRSLARYCDYSSFASAYFTDDGSEGPGVSNLLIKSGFKCLVRSDTRQGLSPTLAQAVQQLKREGVAENDRILYLQDDWIALRKITLGKVHSFLDAHPNIPSFRLIGRYKRRWWRQPTFTTHLAGPGLPAIEWRPVPGYSGFETGEAHWSRTPGVHRFDVFSLACTDVANETEGIKAVHRAGYHTMGRVRRSWFSHIGLERIERWVG